MTFRNCISPSTETGGIGIDLREHERIIHHGISSNASLEKLSIRFTLQGWLRRRCNDRQARRLFPNKDKLAIATLTSSSCPGSSELRLVAGAETCRNGQHFSPVRDHGLGRHLLARAQLRFTEQGEYLTDILLWKFMMRVISWSIINSGAISLCAYVCHWLLVMASCLFTSIGDNQWLKTRAGCGSVVVLESFLLVCFLSHA